MWCLLQDAWFMPTMMCKMMFLTAVQNRRIKSVLNGTCPGKGQKNRFSKLVVIQVYSIRLVVSAAIIAPQNTCSGDLNFWEWFQSRSEHSRLPCVALMGSEVYDDKMWTAHWNKKRLNTRDSRLALSSKSRNERGPCNGWCGPTVNRPSSHRLRSNGLTESGGPSFQEMMQIFSNPIRPDIISGPLRLCFDSLIIQLPRIWELVTGKFKYFGDRNFNFGIRKLTSGELRLK